MLVAQSCLILFDPVDYNLPGSFDHGILQAWILEWVAISSSRGSSQPRDGTSISCIAGRFFTVWALATKQQYVFIWLLKRSSGTEFVSLPFPVISPQLLPSQPVLKRGLKSGKHTPNKLDSSHGSWKGFWLHSNSSYLLRRCVSSWDSREAWSLGDSNKIIYHHP